MAKNQIIDSGGREVSVTDAKALKVDGSAVTQPVSLSSSPLPTGAATETTLGTKLSESDFDIKIGSLTEAAPGTDTASSGLNGRLQRVAQRITSLITAVGSPFQAGGSIGNTSFEATQATAANLNMTEASAASSLTSLQLIDDVVHVDDTATHSTGTTKGVGIMAVANPTDAAIDANDIGMIAMTLARALKIDITTLAGTAIDTNNGNKSAGTQRMVIATDQPQFTAPLNVTIQSGATGGDTVFHLVSAGSTNTTNIKSSAGKVTGWYIYNSNAAARKLVFHDTAGTPTAGASVYFSLMIPPSSGANVSFPDGINFGTGIGISTVTGLADNDTAAVAANDLIINIFYK